MYQEELLESIRRARDQRATRLDLSGGGLTALPPEIGQLSNLTRLYLHKGQVTALPREIGQLTNLRELHLYENQLTAVPPEIGQLAKLTMLDLDRNQLTALPPEMGRLTELTDLRLDENPLTEPPPEVVEQGTAAVVAYLRERLAAGRREWISKMLLVGEGGVGKTCLLRALRGEPFEKHFETTHGIEITPLQLQHPTEAGVTMQLNCWDFGGQEIYHATHQTKPRLHVHVQARTLRLFRQSLAQLNACSRRPRLRKRYGLQGRSGG